MSYFDEAATTWDQEPRRIALMKAVGEAILREVQPTSEMDVLDYGCGTGLLGLFLLPHVRSVTGADTSPGMLEVVEKKCREGGLTNMRGVKLDLEHDPVPRDRYHLIVSSMVMHHVGDPDVLLRAFHKMLWPDGALCIADLDKEPGLFHTPEAAATVPHHGFDRVAFQNRMSRAGFSGSKAVTAHVVQKPAPSGEMREFPVFLTVGRRK